MKLIITTHQKRQLRIVGTGRVLERLCMIHPAFIYLKALAISLMRTGVALHTTST